jgi:hypothetical protein
MTMFFDFQACGTSLFYEVNNGILPRKDRVFEEQDVINLVSEKILRDKWEQNDRYWN